MEPLPTTGEDVCTYKRRYRNVRQSRLREIIFIFKDVSEIFKIEIELKANYSTTESHIVVVICKYIYCTMKEQQSPARERTKLRKTRHELHEKKRRGGRNRKKCIGVGDGLRDKKVRNYM